MGFRFFPYPAHVYSGIVSYTETPIVIVGDFFFDLRLPRMYYVYLRDI